MSEKHSTTAHDDHKLPLWALFLCLLALTAAEVALYDLWVRYHFMPKYALVMLILAFTLPKAAIVMIYFMHLKFEKQIIILLAIVPLVMACGGVLTIVTDTVTLKPHAINQMEKIGDYSHENSHGNHHGHGAAEENSPDSGQ